MTILLFFGVLFILILVHEWGHFIVAKKTGMRVDEFGIGFPPKLFGVKRGETEYTLNALPIGGFVRIYGENAADAASDREAGQEVSGSFSSKSKWAQAAVLIAGVTMNVLLAWILFVTILMIGMPTAVSESEASPDAALRIQAVLPDSPAAGVELPLGATITAVEAGAVTVSSPTPSEFQAVVTEATGAVAISYQIHDTENTVSLTPATDWHDGEESTVGIGLALVETTSRGFFAAIQEATIMTYESLINITVGLATLLGQSVTGDADFSTIAGPVGIVGMVGDAAEFGFTSLLLFMAVISLNLAVINMLPFPALDGGRLVMVAVEAVTRRTIDPEWVMRLNLIGFVLLILLMVAVTYNDILRLL